MLTSNLSIQYSGKSDIGLIRAENQDSFGKFPVDNLDIYSAQGQLFVVADGVGGHRGGKEASSLAVKTIGEVFLKTGISSGALLKKAIEEANTKVFTQAANSREYSRMATTCSAMLLKDEKAVIGHVGDSRIYKIEDNKIEQMTSDHTQVQEMLKEGLLTSDEAENYPSKSVLIRAVGAEEKVKVDIIDNIPLREGQYYVMCSDGLGKVDEDEILKTVLNNTPEDCSRKLIELANERGGKDNVTVLVIKLNSNEILIEKKKSKSPFIYITFSIVVLLLLGFMFRNSIRSFYSVGTTKIKTDTPAQSHNFNLPRLNKSSTSDDLISQADMLLKQGDTEGALKIYRDILNNEPSHLGALNGMSKAADMFFQKAEKYRAANNIKEALKYYGKVLEIQPENEKSNEYVVMYRKQFDQSRKDSVTKIQDFR